MNVSDRLNALSAVENGLTVRAYLEEGDIAQYDAYERMEYRDDRGAEVGLFLIVKVLVNKGLPAYQMYNEVAGEEKGDGNKR